MGSMSTFGSFTAARLGLYASQKALQVTGNNIANVNTEGYSRQVLNQEALRVGGSDRYQSSFDARVGNGVLCTGVSQLRDPYLDIRYRNEESSVGAMNAKLSGLNELASVLDEVGLGEGDGVIEKQFTDLISRFQDLSTNGTGKDEFDALVRSSSSTLVTLFNTYASKLNTIMENKVSGFNQDLTTVNGILKNIQNLNASIRRSQIHGSDALELRDQRNVLIDQLSSYMKIDVTYEQEDIGAGTFVEKLVIKLAGTDQSTNVPRTDQSTLVDGIYATQLSITQVPKDPSDPSSPMVDSPSFNLTLGTMHDNNGEIRQDNFIRSTTAQTSDALKNTTTTVDNGNGTQSITVYGDATYNVDTGLYDIPVATYDLSMPINLSDTDLYGSLQSTREILTEKGEYSSAADQLLDPNATTKRGIPYYQSALDALANKFANVLNGANTLDDSVIYVDPSADPKVLKPEYVNYKGGSLFSNSGDGNDPSGITAANISIAHNWSTGAVHILQSRAPSFTSTDNTNITHMLYLMTADQKYKPNDTVGESDAVYFNGGFQKMYTNITATLANDIKTTTAMQQNYMSAADEIFVDRDSVSGVEINEEVMNMMQYQKSYAAAARLMTTLDEVLDKLINGTGRAGL